MRIKPTTLSPLVIEAITNILNRGNQCEIKRERDNIVIVEIKRNVVVKNPLIEE